MCIRVCTYCTREVAKQQQSSFDNSFFAFFFAFSLDKSPSDLPDPVSDWPGFLEQITVLLETVPMVWNPLTNKMAKWIDVQRLNKMYGRRGKFFYFEFRRN